MVGMLVRGTWRWLLLGAVVGVLLVASLPAWADGEEDEIARARRLMDVKDYDEAIKVLSPLTSSPEPTARDAKKCLASCYQCKKQWDKAIPLFESVLRDYHMDSTSLTYLQTLLGTCLRESGEFEKIVAALKEGPGSTPPPPGTNRIRGERLWCCYVANSDWGVGVPFFNSLVEKWPQDAAEWHLQSARCDRRMGFRAEAIASFKGLIAGYPECKTQVGSAHVCIAECLQSLGKTDEAMAYAKKLYDEQPDMRAPALLAQGILNLSSGKPEQAVAALQRVVFDYPKYSEATLAKSFLVSALRKTGRTDEAVEMLRDSLAGKADPQENAAILLEMGRLYYEAKRHRDAIKVFKETREFKDSPSEKKAEATYLSGLCYKAINYDKSARTCMDEVVRLYLDSRWAKEARGSLYLWADYSESGEAK